MLLAFCLCNFVAFAQKYDTIRIPNGKITITPELAKEILRYSYVIIGDNALIGESNWLYNGIYNFYPDVVNYYYVIDHPELEPFKFGNPEIRSAVSNYNYSSDYTEGYAIVYDEVIEYYEPSREWVMSRPLLFINHGREYGFFNKYALVNNQGKVCIPFKKFELIKYGVYEGLVTVCKEGKWGFASPDGNVKIKLQYEDARHFSEGLAAVKNDGMWGYIDKTGKVIIPFKYTWAGDFKRGVAAVYKGNISNVYSMEKFVPGLVNHAGQSTFDFLGENDIKEYEGPYIDEKTNVTGKVKYTYNEDRNGNRVKHGYYLFLSDYYSVDGHYKDGKKSGLWVEEYFGANKQHDWMTPFYHFFKNADGSKRVISISYVNGVSQGLFKMYDNIGNGEFFAISGNSFNGKPIDSLFLTYYYDAMEVIDESSSYKISLDSSGCIYGRIEFEDKRNTGEIAKTISIIFYKGVPMKVEEYDESTGKRKVLFQYEGFTSVDDIKEIASKGVHLYKIGDNYYELEPKDPRYPFDLFDVDKYSKDMAKDMSFILNLPASWPIQEVESPQLNFFRRTSRDKIKEFEWPKYSNIFDSYSEYSQAYDHGDAMFKQRIEEKLEAKRTAAYNLNKHLFLSRDEFVSYYKQGEAVYNNIVNERNAAYEDYKQNIGWFVDFHDYLKCGQKGRIDDEVNARKTEYEENKGYFTGLTEFIRYYVQEDGSLSAEIDKRMRAYEICKNPDGGYLFKNMAEFLPYYLQGTHNNEYAIRRLQYKMNDFVSLNLKGAKDSKKEEIKQFFVYLAECKAISSAAYPQMIGLLVSTNKKMSKEWEENGQFFVDEVQFYEAYITDEYKNILKSKKK